MNDAAEPRALVEGMYDAFGRGDVEAVVAAMSPGIVWNEAENFPYADGNPYEGPEAVVTGVFGRLVSEWEYWNLDIAEILGSGDKAIAFGRYNAKNKATGKTISAQFVHVWTVEGGKVVRFQQYADTAQVSDAMPAAG